MPGNDCQITSARARRAPPMGAMAGLEGKGPLTSITQPRGCGYDRGVCGQNPQGQGLWGLPMHELYAVRVRHQNCNWNGKGVIDDSAHARTGKAFPSGLLPGGQRRPSAIGRHVLRRSSCRKVQLWAYSYCLVRSRFGIMAQIDWCFRRENMPEYSGRERCRQRN